MGRASGWIDRILSSSFPHKINDLHDSLRAQGRFDVKPCLGAFGCGRIGVEASAPM